MSTSEFVSACSGANSIISDAIVIRHVHTERLYICVSLRVSDMVCVNTVSGNRRRHNQ